MLNPLTNQNSNHRLVFCLVVTVLFCSWIAIVHHYRYKMSLRPTTVTYTLPVFTQQQIAAFTQQQMERDQYDHQQITCIAIAVWGETRGGPGVDKHGVAHSIMNRTRRIRFGNTPCIVVLEPWQYESLNQGKNLRQYAVMTANGTPTLPPYAKPSLMDKIYRISQQAYLGLSEDPTFGSTHFWSPKAQYALGRQAPFWSTKLTHLATLGDHLYYKRVDR